MTVDWAEVAQAELFEDDAAAYQSLGGFFRFSGHMARGLSAEAFE